MFTPLITTVAFPDDLNAAADSVLGDAISQTQSLMESMSHGCSGGSNGMAPFNWGVLQAHGNSAVNALNAARVALRNQNKPDAIQQINSAEGDLDALINGAHYNCAGGAHGMDPVGFDGYLAIKAALKGQLDVVKRFLS